MFYNHYTSQRTNSPACIFRPSFNNGVVVILPAPAADRLHLRGNCRCRSDAGEVRAVDEQAWSLVRRGRREAEEAGGLPQERRAHRGVQLHEQWVQADRQQVRRSDEPGVQSQDAGIRTPEQDCAHSNIEHHDLRLFSVTLKSQVFVLIEETNCR
jgi:hypothetical protein